MDLLEALRAAHTLARGRVAEIKPEDWQLPTPCEEWNVAGLSLHIFRTMCGYDALLTDSFTPETHARIYEIELTRDTVVPMVDEASERLCTRFGGRDILTKSVAYPGLDIKASDLARFSIFECCFHSWDLAHAIGVDGAFSAELAQIGYDGVVPFMDTFRERGVFKPRVTEKSPADSAQARLLHLVGRVP
jgi:uncharacterized protein (TIGR03086 family)